MLTVDDVAEKLQLTRRTIYEYIKQGKLSAVRIGRLYRIEQSALDEFIASLRG